MPSAAAPAEAPTPEPTTPGGNGPTELAGDPPPAVDGAGTGDPAAGLTAAVGGGVRGTSEPNGGNGPIGADPPPPAEGTPPGPAAATGVADADDTGGPPAAAATGAGPADGAPAGAALPAAVDAGGATGGANAAGLPPPPPRPALNPFEKSVEGALGAPPALGNPPAPRPPGELKPWVGSPPPLPKPLGAEGILSPPPVPPRPPEAPAGETDGELLPPIAGNPVAGNAWGFWSSIWCFGTCNPSPLGVASRLAAPSPLTD